MSSVPSTLTFCGKKNSHDHARALLCILYCDRMKEQPEALISVLVLSLWVEKYRYGSRTAETHCIKKIKLALKEVAATSEWPLYREGSVCLSLQGARQRKLIKKNIRKLQHFSFQEIFAVLEYFNNVRLLSLTLYTLITFSPADFSSLC